MIVSFQQRLKGSVSFLKCFISYFLSGQGIKWGCYGMFFLVAFTAFELPMRWVGLRSEESKNAGPSPVWGKAENPDCVRIHWGSPGGGTLKPWSVSGWNSSCLKNFVQFPTWPTSITFHICLFKHIYSKFTPVPLGIGIILHISGHFKSSLKFQAFVPAWRARNPWPVWESDLGFLFDVFLLFFGHIFPV